MSKILVNVEICDNDNKNYREEIEIEIEPIDYLIIQDCMNICDGDTYNKSWDKLIAKIERQYPHLPSEWYVNGTIEYVEHIY